MKIAFFDSGVGGLTVLSEALRQLPDEEYIYYADTDNAPYGVKSSARVKNLVLKAAENLVETGIDALVVACNTANLIEMENPHGPPHRRSAHPQDRSTQHPGRGHRRIAV